MCGIYGRDPPDSLPVGSIGHARLAPAARVLIAVVLVVTAGRALMAVILIVEDDSFICEMAGMMIQDWGHHTLSASDVAEALSLLRSPRQIDALFTDIYLKAAVLGGCELAHQAINLRPQLPVLYTTGNFITDKLKAMFVEGAHVLRKPYTHHQLKASIDGMLAA
jgi:CheY-like chemotaxis protein